MPGQIDEQGNLEPSTATYLMISMTKRCNMRCPGCYYLQQDDDFFMNQDIDLDDAKQIVDYYHAAGVAQAIPNSEGEVLLHPGYTSLLEYINTKGFRYRPWLTTNGIRLPRVAGFVAKNTSEVLVSIDGSTVEKYVASRGGNEALYNKVLAGLRAMVKAARQCTPAPSVIINCVVTADRCSDIPDMIRLAETAGADAIKFTNHHVLNEDDDTRPVTAGDEESTAILNDVLRRTDYSVRIFLPSLYRNTPPPYTCRMMASIMIGSNGDFAPCCRIMPMPEWGNFFTSPDRHNNEALKSFRLSVLNATGREQLPVMCRKCAHLSPQRVAFLPEKKQWVFTALS